MNKIKIIILREYLTRVRKKSFIVMTILGPILMASIWVLPVILATISTDEQTVQVLDETGLFVHRFTDTKTIRFVPISMDIEKAKENLFKTGNDGLLWIPKTELSVPSSGIYYSTGQASLEVISHIKSIMKNEVESLKLEASGIDPEILRSIKSTVVLNTIKISKSGDEEKSFTEISMGVGLFSGVLIYMFIFIFGSQVMRGVMEEKTNRIVEIIISSVKPFELMMGKIVGVALVGLTQFLLWIVLTLAIVTFVQFTMLDANILSGTEQIYTGQSKVLDADQLQQISEQMQSKDSINFQIIEAISSINYGVMIGAFLFFFLGGYLLYAAMFAAIGSAVDNETDSQQFMLPVTIPLILSMVMLGLIINNPSGPVAFWFSIIPFTSPIIMMLRIPFGVPHWQVALSAVLLILGFIFTTWLAAKIYRTGILMYGKKVNYAELWKWLKHN
ncbi:MAG TPA: ABC transporter permease [Bacteroidales bacterium]|nr:ABC transporter permease [Bacteroidales bacterium]HRW97190.1 ABC transporter permease [Bacteroidales bacterium]